MGLFLLKRLAGLILTLLIASLVVFAVLEILPGNAAQVMLGPDAAPDAVQALERQLGLDQPALIRYGQWMTGLLRGNMGTSHAYGSSTSQLIAGRLALTIPLALLAMLLAGVMAIAAGVCDGLGLGHNSRAALITRGLAEMSRLGVARGLGPIRVRDVLTARNALAPASGSEPRRSTACCTPTGWPAPPSAPMRRGSGTCPTARSSTPRRAWSGAGGCSNGAPAATAPRPPCAPHGSRRC